MSKPERQLRLVQAGYILFLVLCISMLHSGVLGNLESAGRAMNVRQYLALVGAIWSAVVGFTFQRKMARTVTRSQRPGTKSTPFTRWRAGHIMRFASATSVGIWGLVLYYFRGPLWVVDVLLVLGLILLVTWRPGATPDCKTANQPSVHA